MSFLLKKNSSTQKGFVVPYFLCSRKEIINVEQQTRIESFKRNVMTKKNAITEKVHTTPNSWPRLGCRNSKLPKANMSGLLMSESLLPVYESETI